MPAALAVFGVQLPDRFGGAGRRPYSAAPFGDHPRFLKDRDTTFPVSDAGVFRVYIFLEVQRDRRSAQRRIFPDTAGVECRILLCRGLKSPAPPTVLHYS